MADFKIRKGLDLPITGMPRQEISGGATVDRVAVIAADFNGMKPKMLVKAGDQVKRGQALFEDRKNPGVLHTAPGAGKVTAVNRGAKRALQSVVIELSENERNNTPSDDDFVKFENHTGDLKPSADDLEKLMVESGIWTSLRARPYNRTPEIGTRPECLFLTCTDSEPLSPDVSQIIKGNEEDFRTGAAALTVFAKQKTYLCTEPGDGVPTDISGTENKTFTGKHPFGLAGTHMNKLYPASRKRLVWNIQLQDIISLGRLLKTGKLDVERIVSIAGPPVEDPRLLKTRIGASTDVLAEGQFPAEGEYRVISGSPLSGRTAMGDVHGYIGRRHQQITILREGREQEFIGWLLPGFGKFSSIPAFFSAMTPGKKYNFSTTTHGEHREMVPIGMYERVMPLDIMPTFLLRAMETGDLERAEQLGALELDEEDLALCSFVCPGKQDYGQQLSKTLDEIHKEG